jgi:hypothetical protein
LPRDGLHDGQATPRLAPGHNIAIAKRRQRHEAIVNRRWE